MDSQTPIELCNYREAEFFGNSTALVDRSPLSRVLVAYWHDAWVGHLDHHVCVPSLQRFGASHPIRYGYHSREKWEGTTWLTSESHDAVPVNESHQFLFLLPGALWVFLEQRRVLWR